MERKGRYAREGMTNKPRGVGDKTAHWPRVRLTTLLVARPFFLASGQPGHSCFEHRRKRTSSNHCTGCTERRGRRSRKKERNIQTFLSRQPGKLNSTCEIERGNSTRFEPPLCRSAAPNFSPTLDITLQQRRRRLCSTRNQHSAEKIDRILANNGITLNDASRYWLTLREKGKKVMK